MIDHQRLYEYRFREVDQLARQRVWNVIAADVHRRMGEPSVVLDPAAGRCEFINAVDATERWIVDRVDQCDDRDPSIRAVIGDIFSADLPADHFDGVFVSNFLEHLASQDEVAALLARLRDAMAPGGRLAVMGPNFKYCARDYFDCADHTLALSHVAVAEHLYAAGFAVEQVIPRFLPFSFRGKLPPSPALVRRYLHHPLLWRLWGKQFLVICSKPGGA